METKSPIRLATPADEPEILQLLHVMWKESGWRPLDIECARELFARAFARQGGILAVIGVPGHIRGMIYLLITRTWYTRDNHLEELFCWVHPEHRKSDYSKLLIDYAKSCSDQISEQAGKKVPLLMGVLTNRRMAAKVRLYRRFFGIPVGAFFVHNADWVNKAELSEEDIFRVPSLGTRLFRREERRGKREKMRAQI